MQTYPISHPSRLFSAIWLILFSLLALAACSPLARGQRSPELHILELRLASPLPAKAGAGPVVVVNLPWAAPGYDTASMAYLRQAGQLEYFAFHRWTDAPARMLQPLLVQALDHTGFFKAVVQAPSPLHGDLVLESELLRLRQVFAESGEGFMDLVLRVQLIGGNKVLATRVFDQREATASEDPQGGVAAAGLLLEKLLPEIAAFCVAQAQNML